MSRRFTYNTPSRLEINRLPNVIGMGARAIFTNLERLFETGLLQEQMR